MKKIVALFLSVIMLSFAVFAGKMNERFFELRVDAPIDFSNNAFALLDLFQSDELVIDFGEIADSMPDEGWTIRSNSNPMVQVKLNVGSIKVALSGGMDLYGTFNLDKSLFNFIAYGNKLNEVVAIQPSVYSELFFDVEANVGFELGDMAVTVTPSLFIPFMSIKSDETYLKFQNTSDGDFIASMSGSVDIYSQFAIDDTGNGLDLSHVSSKDGSVQIFSKPALMKYLSVAGIDMAGTVEMPFSFFDAIKFSASVRCPIIPGKLTTKTSFSTSEEYKTSISDLVQDYIDSTNKSGDDETEEGELEAVAKEEDEKSPMNLADLEYSFYSEETVYKINRPFKFMGYATFQPFGELLTAKAGLGFGVRSPLSENATFYPEYYLGGGVSILGGLLSAFVSTEYRNQIYMHQANVAFSVRAFELDVGIGTEGPNLAKSFNLSGIRAYVGVAVGI